MKIKTKSQIANVQPEPKPNSELLPIASTSSPTIGNTLVVRSFFSMHCLYFPILFKTSLLLLNVTAKVSEGISISF